MKKIFAFLFIVGVCFGVWFGFNNNKKDDDKLLDLGFTKEEVTNIRKNFDDKVVDKLISLENKDIIKEIINDDSFDKGKIDDYLAYYQNNKDMKISNVVKLVNNDIDKIKDLEYDDVILSLVDEDYFIYDNTSRYVDYYKNHDIKLSDVISIVNANADYKFYTNTKETDMSKGYLILVNKYYHLSSNYEPNDLVYIERPYSPDGGRMRKEAYEAFKDMVDDADEDGLYLFALSPYRSYDLQVGVYDGWVSRDGKEKADMESARAGYSEHQTGLCVDINSVEDDFAYTDEAKWLAKNAYKYGFTLRFPKGKEHLTGYQYEPWHYRYVGKEAAKQMYDENLTLEEYYAYYVK